MEPLSEEHLNHWFQWSPLGRWLQIHTQPLKVRLQYIADIPWCLGNGKLGSDPGHSVFSNISHH